MRRVCWSLPRRRAPSEGSALVYPPLQDMLAGRTVQQELGCAESWHGRAVGSFPLTMWLPHKYRPSELSTQEQPRQKADGKGRLHDQHIAGRMLATVRAWGPERGLCGEKMSGPHLHARRNRPPLLLEREAVIQAPGVSQRYASQTKQVVYAQGVNPLRASVGVRAQLPAPDAPWRQSSGIGLPTRIRGSTHGGLGRQSSRQWHGMARDALSCARLVARAMTHQKRR